MRTVTVEPTRTSLEACAASSSITCASSSIFSISRIDRKSTRLNSSHLGISYAVFCLKKKKETMTCPHKATQQTEPQQTKAATQHIHTTGVARTTHQTRPGAATITSQSHTNTQACGPHN